MMSGLLLLSVLLITTGVRGFKLDQDSDSKSHWEITEQAILDVTARACHALALEEGREFTFPATLTAESLLEACAATSSARNFAINKFYIKGFNALVNVDYALSASHHFDDESFDKGKELITDGLYTVKANIKRGNYAAARSKLGEILHTLQDFYSHSNWIEMGNDLPNKNLIKKDATLETAAAKNRPTCRNCTENCTNNILEDILKENLLTSAYFSPFPLNNKPTGKCSHGDSKDNTRHSDATGGINKDSVKSSHGHLHIKAAQVATAATSELLDDVLAAVGHKDFLRMMMGVSPGKALSFVIDTTGSMGFVIEAVKFSMSAIINNLVGTANEPSVYVLVTFNDPEFGPVIKTPNLSIFKNAIDKLSASGGGDEPELSLSGLQLALNAVPFGSEIYVFTDATAKDKTLKNSIITLIERKQCVVNFLISKTDLQEPIYTDVAKASGGQLVKVSKYSSYPVIQVFLNAHSSNLVTLLQATRNQSENFTFSVGKNDTNLRVTITGTNTFTLISPSGTLNEPLATTQVGNLLELKLSTEEGQWEIRITSSDPYTLKITAQSSNDFFFSFMKPSQVRSDGYVVNIHKPSAMLPGTLMVVLFGTDTTTLKDVYLVKSSGSGQVKGNITGQENNEYLVEFDELLFEEFTVQVELQRGSSSRLTRSTSGIFQRQSNVNIKASFFTVTTSIEDTVSEPGSTHVANITISNHRIEGEKEEEFTISATNTQNFEMISPPTIKVLKGSSATFTVQTIIPNTTEFATEVTQTVMAVAPDALEFNYAVTTYTVIKNVMDIQAPEFELLTPQPHCPDVNSSICQYSIRVTDNTRIETIYEQEGNRRWETLGNETVVSYNDSCCSPMVEILAVDGVGNVGKFKYNASMSTTTTTTSPTLSTTMQSTTKTTRPTTTTTQATPPTQKPTTTTTQSTPPTQKPTTTTTQSTPPTQKPTTKLQSINSSHTKTYNYNYTINSSHTKTYNYNYTINSSHTKTYNYNYTINSSHTKTYNYNYTINSSHTKTYNYNYTINSSHTKIYNYKISD
ncbi:von Willebrand factor A domain-containing protein 7-like [Boleophthalmus pectinirostris]|uniref:von Willebrand factor A domain-containing protein 7-like n=1 Tax=Boleophthalmus pectinirostris TaxID=150288 RepID=UPI002430B2C7|nr:von Willebrand factor A domain-containing protein 7-like [Boleophthalmus pectinirostris]